MTLHPSHPTSAMIAAAMAAGAAAATTAGAAPVVINELHFDEPDKTLPAEFIELFNPTASDIDVSGWAFTDGVSYEIPAGTTIAPGGFLVVAEDPATVASHFGFAGALGPWTGSLSNRGEKVTLRDASGSRIDSVDYGLGFPWPTVGEEPGSSAELLHPSLDNDLGGNWRSSGNSLGGDIPPAVYLAERSSAWTYHKGTSFPADDSGGRAWTDHGYLESQAGGWQSGGAPVGIGDGDDVTELTDMQGSYITVFLRHEFTVAPGLVPATLDLGLLYDDALVIWINGQEVARPGLSEPAGTPVPFPPPDFYVSSHEADGVYEPITVENAATFLNEGTNTIAVQVINQTIGSSDVTADVSVSTPRQSAGEFTQQPPTPGAQNSVFTTLLPPALRQVEHTPNAPTPNSPVTVTCKVTAPGGVDAVTLSYQIVEPGDYIKRSDPRYDSDWTTVPMADDGTGGDTAAGDATYTAVLPPELQVHRRLVRYRIAAGSADGVVVTAPYADDPQPNFAYFTYGEVPTWAAADRPGATPEVTYDLNQFDNVAVYHLITSREEHEDSQYIPTSSLRSGYTGSDYRWEGTLVYEGKVYDHIRFRARGGVWRYAMGKNMWKFDFNRGHQFRARDDYGRRYNTDWDKLNFSAIIQQEDIGKRGEQGLFEWAGFKLHNLLGNPASYTHFVHFRIVESADENGTPNNQFDTDFQGLYLAVEQMDGRFLDEHGLPDGNLYKMENGTGPGNGASNNQGPDQPSNNADLVAFTRAYPRGDQDWWEQNFDLENYYSFYAAVTAVHDNDIHAGKNYFFFNNPETAKWEILNWDLDLCWTTTYREFEPTNDPVDDYVFRNDDFIRDYKNRLREMVDLVFNRDQTGKLLDECARFIYTPGETSFVDADRAMWDYNPIMRSRYVNSSKSGQGRYYNRLPGGYSRDFAGMLESLKDYVTFRTDDYIYDKNGRGSYRRVRTNLRTEADDIPATPTATYTGDAGFPADAVSLQSSAFTDPQGDNTFAGMQWRIGEIYHDGTANYVDGEPFVYEIEPLWSTGTIEAFDADIDVPADVLRPDRTYRARVRHLDADGNWSHWSAPVEFVASAPDVTFYQQNLAVTEFMYHPHDASAAEQVLGYGSEDFEWLQLENIGAVTVDLTGLRFTKGVDFDIAEGTLLEPGGTLLIVSNPDAFAMRYGDGLPVAGSYAPDNLANGGEQVKLSLGAGTPVIDFTYDDQDPWPAAADGDGFSIVLSDTSVPRDHVAGESWTASGERGGNPGGADTPYQFWAAAEGVTDKLQDDDGDGLVAIVEFYLNTSDSTPDTTPPLVPALSEDGTTVLVALSRRATTGGVQGIVESTTDLNSWAPLPASFLQSVTPGPDGTLVEIWALPATAPGRQLRLRVEG